MGQITSGIVRYERTLNLGDYNNKKAAAEISFTSEGDHQAMLDQAATIAIGKVHELLAIAEKAPATRAAATPAKEPAPPAGPTKADLVKQAEAAVGKPEAKPVGRPPAKKPPPAPKQPDPAEIDEGPEVIDDLSDLTGDAPAAPPAKEVTDQDIVAAITKKNQALKDAGCTTGALMIRTLIGEFIAPPGQARQIDQAKRGDFMKKLEALKPAS